MQCENIFGWCGISFIHGMSGTEVIVMLNTAGTISVTDYYSSDYVQPTQKIPTNLVLKSSSVNGTGIYGEFTRPLETTDLLNKHVYVGLSTDFSFAYLTTANLGFIQHDHIGMGSISLGNSQSTSAWNPNGFVETLPNVS